MVKVECYDSYPDRWYSGEGIYRRVGLEPGGSGGGICGYIQLPEIG